MKYLLHSRKFRSNLFKWLFCYIGTLALFTAVVTYSRYIASCAMSDNTKVAAFGITVSKDATMCDSTLASEDNQCQLGNMRMKKEMSFYFDVNASKLEVDSFFVATAKIDPKFTYKELYIWNGTTWDLVDTTDSTRVDQVVTTYSPLSVNKQNLNQITISDDIIVSRGYVRKYKMICTYNNYSDINYINGGSFPWAVSIGYSLAQQ